MAKVSYANMKLKMNESVKEVQLGETKFEVKQYLPVEEKYSFLNIVLQNSLDNGIYHPVKVDMYFHLYLVYLYANINFTDKQREDENKLFDVLLTNGVIGSVIANIPKDEYDVLVSLLNQMIEKNEKYRITFGGILDKIINELPMQLESMQKILEEMKPEQLVELSKIMKITNS